MRRRGDTGVPVPPDELLVFDGREHTTQAAWEAAYGAWFDARQAWQDQHLHPGQELPSTMLSTCPFDPSTI